MEQIFPKPIHRKVFKLGRINIMEKYKVYIIEEDGKTSILDENEHVENLTIITNDICENNVIVIHKPYKFIKGTVIDLRGVGAKIELESTKYAYNFRIMTASGATNQKLEIGKNCSFWTGINFNLTDDKAHIHVGEDCMFSKDIDIWASDGHAIIDMNTGNVFNTCTNSVEIGNHVWIGAKVILTKNASIPDGCVVGTGSVLTTKINDKNVVVAGNPAKIIKKNIEWSRKRPNTIEKKKKKIVAIIPSRYQSSRFPGKPLAIILGKPMIQWVYERVLQVKEITSVYVATDSQEIYDAVTNFGGNAILTGECKCGTDRVYQASKNMDADIILNIQGDEPLIKKEMIESIIAEFSQPEVNMVTLKKRITNLDDVSKSNVVKVITDIHNDAIYFSRSPIPFDRDGNEESEYYKHIGIYGYTKDFLNTFVNLKRSKLECMENLEQLRAIENGYKIRVVETQYDSVGVDLPEHIALVEEAMKKEL